MYLVFYCSGQRPLSDCAALEDLDTEMETNSACETIGENIKSSAKESLGYCEL
jgi:hypothetical protein